MSYREYFEKTPQTEIPLLKYFRAFFLFKRKTAGA